MNSYSINYATQNQSAPYLNYRPGPFPNPIPAPINNFNQAIPQYISPQPVNMNLDITQLIYYLLKLIQIIKNQILEHFLQIKM